MLRNTLMNENNKIMFHSRFRYLKFLGRYRRSLVKIRRRIDRFLEHNVLNIIVLSFLLIDMDNAAL